MSEPIRIAHIITGLETGGAQTVLGGLVRSMDRARFENLVVSMTAGGAVAESIRAIGVRVESLRMRRGMPDPRGVWRLRSLLRDFRPSVLQTWLYHADLLGTAANLLGGKRALAWNVRCANMDMTQYRALSGLTLRTLAKLSGLPDVVVINSESGRLTHEAIGYRPRRWEVIPNGFDTDRFRPQEAARARLRDELRLDRSAFVAGLVARLDPMKDHETFLAAARRAAALRDLHFVLAGDGVERLESQLNQSGLAGRVHLLGRRSDIDVVVAGLDVACSSSITEGFPNAVGEAMAAGVPCVATDVGDTRWLLGEGGAIVPPRDPRAFADALITMVDRPAGERQAIGQRGRDRILEHFTLASAVERYQDVYARLASAPAM